MPGLRLVEPKRAIIIGLAVLLQFVPPVSGGRALAEEDLLPLLKRVVTLTRGGKLDEAIKVQGRVIAGVEKMAGTRHPLYLTQMAMLGDLYVMKNDYATGKRLHVEVLRLRERLLGKEHADVAASLAKLANLYISMANYRKAESAVQRVISIRRKALPPSDPDYGYTYMILGRLDMLRLRHAAADRHFRRALKLFKQHLKPNHPYIPLAQNNLAEAVRALGGHAEAERLLRAALAGNERIHGSDSHAIAPNLNNLSELLRGQGRYGEAEQLRRRAMAVIEKTLGPGHPSIAVDLNNLALLMIARGREQEAVGLLRRALKIQRKTFGAAHPHVASTLSNLAEALARSGKLDEAERHFRQALALRARANGPRDLSVAISLHKLAAFLYEHDRLAEAEPLARRSLEIRSKGLHPNHPLLASTLSNLAVILDDLGRHAEARSLHQRSFAIMQGALSRHHPEYARSLTNLALNLADTGDWRGAYSKLKQGNQIWIERRVALRGATPSASTSGPDSELRQNADSFLGQIRAGYELWRAASPAQRRILLEESFAAHQWASLSSAASAVNKLSARIAAGRGPLSDIVRKQQDLGEQLMALDKTLIRMLSGPPDARRAESEADLRKRAEATRQRLAGLSAELSGRFPEFAALASPQPVSIADVRRALKPNEALYTIALTRYGSFAWVVTPDTERWVHIDRTRSQFQNDVDVLRCGLDITAWGSDGRCSRLTGVRLTRKDVRAGKQPPFDIVRAHSLYQTLFSQVEDLIKGRQLIVVPTGPLKRLPFHVLVAGDVGASSSGMDAYRNTDWLVRQTPITVLPAMSSLPVLRRPTKGTVVAEPYLGFGNPLLDGPNKRYARLAGRARANQKCNASTHERVVRTAGLSSRAGEVMTTGGLADVAFLRKQSPLPETAEELCTVASALKADSGAVHLGARATEADVKRRNESGELAHYRVLHFATHAALAGEAVGLVEPGLIFTPPAAATKTDDGYLSASEIGTLHLDADLVILSACNTAAGGAGDSDALAGLARSFFYAGARSLFVSHWAVHSDATVKLIAAALSAAARDAGRNYAEALRQAMVTLIDRGSSTEAHPAFWAPFVAVGVAPTREDARP